MFASSDEPEEGRAWREEVARLEATYKQMFDNAKRRTNDLESLVGFLKLQMRYLRTGNYLVPVFGVLERVCDDFRDAPAFYLDSHSTVCYVTPGFRKVFGEKQQNADLKLQNIITSSRALVEFDETELIFTDDEERPYRVKEGCFKS